MEIAVFIICSIVAIGAALMVVTQRNPVTTVLFLVAVFMALAVLFVQLYAAFLAMLQIIVYAGAIMVLFLFVIMLLNLRREEYGKDLRLRVKPLAVTFVVMLFTEIVVITHTAIADLAAGKTAPKAFGSITEIGKLIFTDYLYPFELTSVLLLVAILGAVVMGKKRL